MAEVAKRDQVATRRRILDEFEKVQTRIATNPELWRKLSFEGHENLCEVLGDDFMVYPEFEFWFSRFLQGNFNLHHDRSSDPKARLFTDLPLEVFENVAEYLELEDRMQLGNVCKDIRFQVDNWDLKLDELWYCGANDWVFDLNSKPHCPRSIGQNKNKRFNSDLTRNPISFVMNILRLPKLQLEKLEIVQQDDYWEKLIKKLDESNRKLHVKEIEYSFHFNPPVRKVKVEFPYFFSSKIDLHFMIPGVLEEIKLYLMNPTREELNEIVGSEQCQAAKMVHIESRMVSSRFPLVALYNCPRFTLQLGGRPADSVKAAFLKTLMNKGKVQKCVLYGRRKIMKYLNKPETMVPDFESLRRYPIKGTNEFYELEYREEGRPRKEFIRLERKQ